MMFQQPVHHSRKSKGPKIKQILQFLLLVAVVLWFLYHIRNSYNRKIAYSESNENKVNTGLIELYLGRKGYRSYNGQIPDGKVNANFGENVETREDGGGDSVEPSGEVLEEALNKDQDENIAESQPNDRDEVNNKTNLEEEKIMETSKEDLIEDNRETQEEAENLNGNDSEKQTEEERNERSNVESQNNSEDEGNKNSENEWNSLQTEKVPSNEENENIQDIKSPDLSKESKNANENNENSGNSGNDDNSEKITSEEEEESNEVIEANSQDSVRKDGIEEHEFHDSNGVPQGEGIPLHKTGSQSQEETSSYIETVSDSVGQFELSENTNLGAKSNQSDITNLDDGNPVNLTISDDRNVTNLPVENDDSLQPKDQNESEAERNDDINKGEVQTETAQIIKLSSSSTVAEENKFEMATNSENSTAEIVKSEEKHASESETMESNKIEGNTSISVSDEVTNSSLPDDQNNIAMSTGNEALARKTVESQDDSVSQAEITGDEPINEGTWSEEVIEQSNGTNSSRPDMHNDIIISTGDEFLTNKVIMGDSEAVISGTEPTKDETSGTFEGAKTIEQFSETNSSLPDNEVIKYKVENGDSEIVVSGTEPTQGETSGLAADEATGSVEVTEQHTETNSSILNDNETSDWKASESQGDDTSMVQSEGINQMSM